VQRSSLWDVFSRPVSYYYCFPAFSKAIDSPVQDIMEVELADANNRLGDDCRGGGDSQLKLTLGAGVGDVGCKCVYSLPIHLKVPTTVQFVYGGNWVAPAVSVTQTF
jgi:hypothetical protein